MTERVAPLCGVCGAKKIYVGDTNLFRNDPDPWVCDGDHLTYWREKSKKQAATIEALHEKLVGSDTHRYGLDVWCKVCGVKETRFIGSDTEPDHKPGCDIAPESEGG